MKLLVATRNLHKLDEIRAVFSIKGLELLSVNDVPGLPEVDEDGDTFEANATKKAVTLAIKAGLWALADDSGLEVTALNMRPGVWSARYAGEPVDYAANNAKLLGELAGKSDRSARFRCVIAVSSPKGETWTVEGICQGRISVAPRGTNGFGYDPVFVPDGEKRTFAEMPGDEKNAISHRGRALALAKREWKRRMTT